MQTTFYDSLQGLQQSLQNLKSQANFSDPELSSKFSDLVDSLMSFAEESTTSVNEVATNTPVAVQPEEVRTTSDHFSNKVTVASAPVVNTSVNQMAQLDVEISNVDALEESWMQSQHMSINESYLTTSLKYSRDHKPTVKELMDATGLEFNEAGALIGVGAAGHNDMRDWSKIMSASDPAGALRIANGQLFNDVEWMPYTPDKGTISEDSIIAKTDNYTLATDRFGTERLFITDGKGRKLTEATFNPDLMRHRSSLYGIDPNNLANLNADGNANLAKLLQSIT